MLFPQTTHQVSIKTPMFVMLFKEINLACNETNLMLYHHHPGDGQLASPKHVEV
jgi:hypothetical protein